MRPASAVLLLPLACAGPSRDAAEAPAAAPSPTPVAPRIAEPTPPVEPPTPAPTDTPSLLAQARGDGLLVSGREGIELLTPDLERLALLTPERGRHLRVVGDQLYYFDLKQPRLRALDLNSGQTRAVAELPRLRNDCFDGGRPTDPLAYVQSPADLAVQGGHLCFDVSDRRREAATETYNYRVDLTSGAVERRMVEYLGGDVCGQTREREQPRLCTPASPAGPAELLAPSGRWAFAADRARGDYGDRAYALATVVDREAHRRYAIVGRKLRALQAGRETPVGACMVVDQAAAEWLSGSDVLLVSGCRDRLTVVHPPGRVDVLAVDGLAVVPPEH